jgi:hypothetical protein
MLKHLSFSFLQRTLINNFITLTISVAISFAAFYISNKNNLLDENDQVNTLYSVALGVVLLQLTFVLASQVQLQYLTRLLEFLKASTFGNVNLTRFGDDIAATDYILSREKDIMTVYNTRFSTQYEFSRSRDQVLGQESYNDYNEMIKRLVRKGVVWKDIVTMNMLSIFDEFFEIANETTTFYSMKVVNTSPRYNFIILIYKDGSEELIINWDFVRDNQPKPILIRDADIVASFRSHFNDIWDDYHTSYETDNKPQIFAADYTYTSTLLHFRTRDRALDYIKAKIDVDKQLESIRNVNLIAEDVSEQLIAHPEKAWEEFNRKIIEWLDEPDNFMIEIHGERNLKRLQALNGVRKEHKYEVCVGNFDEPMPNYATLHFRDGRRIVMFGWGYLKDAEKTEIFVSDTRAVADYFDAHFNALRRHATRSMHIQEFLAELAAKPASGAQDAEPEQRRAQESS